MGGKQLARHFRRERFYFVMVKYLAIFGGSLDGMVVCVTCSSYM